MLKKIKKSSSGFGAVEGVLAIVILCAAGLTGWYVWHSSQQKTAPQNIASPNLEHSNAAQLQPGVTPGPGADWNTYTNKTLGFSIQMPKEFNSGLGGMCTYHAQQKSYYAANGVVPAGIFQDGDNFWIDGLYSYQLTGEKAGPTLTTFSGCKKVITTAAFIEQALNPTSHTSPYQDYALPFSVVPVSNNAGIDNWVQTKFGNQVYVSTITHDKSGWQDVNLHCKDSNQQIGCLNYSYQLRYYPTQQRLVYLEQGQAVHLMTPDNNASYDQQVLASFKLL